MEKEEEDGEGGGGWREGFEKWRRERRGLSSREGIR